VVNASEKLKTFRGLFDQHTPSRLQALKMSEPTYFLVFFVALFSIMSVIFALAGLGAYTEIKRGAWERAFSIGLSLLCSAGFVRLAIESAGRI
jgi:hypothetical protein